MKKIFTVSIEINSTTKENQAAFDALVTEAFETLKAQVTGLENVVTLKASVTEAAPAAPPAPVPAPAAPKA